MREKGEGSERLVLLELRGWSFFFKFVSGKQCKGERRLDRLSSVFGHSRKVGFPDLRCVRVGRES